jgi:predicted metal-dependent phosphoesterase TrpH
VIDLHCHSTASDGLLGPSEVVRFAAKLGLSAIALTDHDTTAGLAEAQETGLTVGVRVIGGCEFSVAAEWGEMHVLGLFVPSGDAVIEGFLTNARADRERRARAMVSALTGLGIRISYAEVLLEAAGGAVGRPHVARALLNVGAVKTVQEAFDRYIGKNRPAYVDKGLPTFAEVARIVHASGGIVSAAHLRYRATLALLTHLQAEGLDAVETRHPSHDGEVVANITAMAAKLGLARSGGSDWHGELHPEAAHAMLGVQAVPEEWLSVLEASRPPARAVE